MKNKTDLKNRERVNFVVDAELMKQLRLFSDKSKIPMSRIIDQAIKNILSSSIP